MDYVEQAVGIATADAEAMNEQGESEATSSVQFVEKGKGKSALDLLKEKGIEI